MERDSGWVKVESQFRNYLLSCGRSKETARTYLGNVSIFWRYCARYEITPFDADRPLMRAFVAERRSQVSPDRVHNDVSGLRHFYAWLRETRYRDDDPLDGIHVKRPKTLPTKPFEEYEVEALFGACRDERDRLFLLTLGFTGIRISECAAMEAEDIDWKHNILRVHGKGDILYEIGRRAGVQDVHPHRLRATFATFYINQYGDIQALQGLMGHESITTTSRYTEYTKLKRGHEQMRGLAFAPQLLTGIPT